MDGLAVSARAARSANANFAGWHRASLRVGSEFAGRDIAQIAVDVHRLMVADERVDGAAGSRGLLFEFHQQVHHGARVGTTIDDVAGLDEVRLAARPIAVSVDQARGGEHARELLVIAVDVTDGDDALDAGPDVLFGFGLAFGAGGLPAA